jgi:hypothetical protein
MREGWGTCQTDVKHPADAWMSNIPLTPGDEAGDLGGSLGLHARDHMAVLLTSGTARSA